MKQEFKSVADEIRFYIRELLEDQKPHKVKEIKEYVESKVGKNWSTGCYAGAIRDLVAKEPQYVSVERGVYVYQPEAKNILEKSVNKILKKTIDDLYIEANKVNVLNITAEDITTINKIKEITDYLEKIIN